MGQQNRDEACSMAVVAIPMGGAGRLLVRVGTLDISMPGHQRYDRARDFILFVPGWVSWSSSRTSCLPGGGMMIRDPLRRHPSRTLSSLLREEYGRYSLSNNHSSAWDSVILT